jgi:AraC-like DNA-binding protein
MRVHEKASPDESVDESVRLLVENDRCAVYKVENASGEGLITCYQVFPGIALTYNDFHIERCASRLRPRPDMFFIDHCREGRIEWELDNGSCMYQEPGILRFDTREKYKRNFTCPLRHYHGLTIGFFVDEAQKSLSAALEGFTVDLRSLREKFCPDGWPRTATANTIPGFHFESLYNMNDAVRQNLSRLKILELLLHLEALPAGNGFTERLYFRKTRVDTVKAIERFMTAHPETRYTLGELAERFNISLTSMKDCFKGVYGSSIYAYMRTWRMNAAAVMLRQTDENIIAIAGDLGYDNASKFSSAFREVMGKTPREYRKGF